MICEKCGKSNISNVSGCAYCGAEMPKTTGGGGFADILSYNAAGGAMPGFVVQGIQKNDNFVEGVSKSDMQKLMRKSDNILRANQKNSLIGLVAVGLSLLILVTSIVLGIITINAVNGYKEETMTQIEEMKEEMKGYESRRDIITGDETVLERDIIGEDVENKGKPDYEKEEKNPSELKDNEEDTNNEKEDKDSKEEDNAKKEEKDSSKIKVAKDGDDTEKNDSETKDTKEER